MAIALLLFDLAGLVGYLLTIGSAILAVRFQGAVGAPEPTLFARHVLFALPTLLFVLFGQSMTMFYFIGLGKQAREAAEAISETAGRRMRALVRAQKGPVFRTSTWAVAFAIGAFVLGGAVHTGRIHRGWHLATTAAAVIFHALAMREAILGMGDLHDWLGDPERAAAEPASEPASESSPLPL